MGIRNYVLKNNKKPATDMVIAWFNVDEFMNTDCMDYSTFIIDNFNNIVTNAYAIAIFKIRMK